MIIILMGVSGSGKTTVGRLLAASLAWPFFDADDFHPPENLAKMGRGVPLDDDDRNLWLDRLAKKVDELALEDISAILTCSCLKEDYRARIAAARDRVEFVYLKGDFKLLEQRLGNRTGHFFRAELLASQFEALEEPRAALVIHVSDAIGEILDQIRSALSLGPLPGNQREPEK